MSSGFTMDAVAERVEPERPPLPPRERRADFVATCGAAAGGAVAAEGEEAALERVEDGAPRREAGAAATGAAGG